MEIAWSYQERSGGPDMVGQVAQVRRGRHDQRVQSERLQRAPYTHVPGGEDVRSGQPERHVLL